MIDNETRRKIIIEYGAGAGLSSAAGYEYSGKRFHENFHDFEAKYNFHDMYTGGFYPYKTLEEYWAYWSRYIFLNRYTESPKPVYEELCDIVNGKNYFVLTVFRTRSRNEYAGYNKISVLENDGGKQERALRLRKYEYGIRARSNSRSFPLFFRRYIRYSDCV